MAEIVNKKQAVVSTKPQYSEAAKTKHDLYNHVAVDELYAYNEPIVNLNTISKTFFSQYIQNGIKYWSEKLAGIGFAGAQYGPIRGDVSSEVCMLPIKHREGLDEGEPTDVCISIMEMVDPLNVSYKEVDVQINRLHEYIDLGLYPLVTMPISEDDLFYGFEKYDDTTKARDVVGTIVDVSRSIENDGKTHVIATILWDPYLPSRTSINMLMAKTGYLKMVDMILTPEKWKDMDRGGHTNMGVPIYEFTSMNQSIYEIGHVADFEDMLNEAVVTNRVNLDFVTHLLQHTGATLSELMDKLSSNQEKMEGTAGQKEASQTPVNADIQEDVPVENAAERDVFGHMLRLYEEDFSNVPDDDSPAEFDFR